MKTLSDQLTRKRLLALLAFSLMALATPTMAQVYNTGDIAVINNIIDKNGLKLTKAATNGYSVPTDWTNIVSWSTGQTGG
ncbi:MAG: hypothetical protein LBD21_05610 [Tannerellaceae bacterium]|jgi:hypothetical protein|nr:hypothetical protein [Tannerellaceae bacterium]